MMHFIQNSPIGDVYVACIVCAGAVVAIIALCMVAVYTAHVNINRFRDAHRRSESFLEEYNDK